MEKRGQTTAAALVFLLIRCDPKVPSRRRKSMGGIQSRLESVRETAIEKDLELLKELVLKTNKVYIVIYLMNFYFILFLLVFFFHD